MDSVKKCPPAATQSRTRRPITVPQPSRVDEAELDADEVAHWADRARKLPSVRRELVERVKAEIEAGTYETSDRLDAAIDRLIEELRQEG